MTTTGHTNVRMADRPTADQRCGTDRATIGNLILDYYDRYDEVLREVVDDPDPVTQPGRFSPGFTLPEPTGPVREFFAAAQARWQPLAPYGGHRIRLLDLAGNPGTHTTKTYPSLLIVARAVDYIHRTGEPIVIFSPTSANKGTALRDAVLRAYDAGLVTADQLRVAILAPRQCLPKLRASRLSTDPGLAARNPLLLHGGDRPEAVKTIGREFVDRYAADLRRQRGANLWFSLALPNYLVADTARAFFENRVEPTDGAPPRLHAQSVSSAYGLLGYHAGRRVLEAAGQAAQSSRPASLLIQHLATADMVLNLRHGDFETGRPDYRYDADAGLYRQDTDSCFPEVTADPAEPLDPTFYTHRPPTSPAMNDIIAAHGGGGIVVSLAECLDRYARLRAWLGGAARPLPADPRALREWSLVMALTGVCNAVDRGLVDDDRDIVLHGTGWYGDGDYQPLPESAAVPADTAADIAAAVLG